MNAKQKALEYCNDHDYIIIEETDEGLVVWDRNMNKGIIPYIMFEQESYNDASLSQ